MCFTQNFCLLHFHAGMSFQLYHWLSAVTFIFYMRCVSISRSSYFRLHVFVSSFMIFLSVVIETLMTKHIPFLSQMWNLGLFHGMALSVIISWFHRKVTWLSPHVSTSSGKCSYHFSLHFHSYLFTDIKIELFTHPVILLTSRLIKLLAHSTFTVIDSFRYPIIIVVMLLLLLF